MSGRSFLCNLWFSQTLRHKNYIYIYLPKTKKFGCVGRGDLTSLFISKVAKWIEVRGDLCSNVENKKSFTSRLNLKNLDNLIFRGYNYIISYNKAIPFYNKTFNLSFKKNDFIELYIKVLLNYTDINDKIYVKSIYQIKNNDMILYTNIIDHNKYSYFDNYLTIDETMFYTFDEDINNITFSFNFETIKNNINDIKYIFKNNNRLILKHYGN